MLTESFALFLGNGCINAAMQERGFDLVLMDMRMPGMDGVTATEAIRRLPGSERTILIIGLTANATPEDAARCRPAGMNDHMIKPRRPHHLTARGCGLRSLTSPSVRTADLPGHAGDFASRSARRSHRRHLRAGHWCSRDRL